MPRGWPRPSPVHSRTPWHDCVAAVGLDRVHDAPGAHERTALLDHLARRGADFPLSVLPVLDALEEHVVLLRLLGIASDHDEVSVRIGHENPYTGLQGTSMVTAGYGTGVDLVAGLGVVGPTRMDYPTTMAAVRAVATYVSRILAQ